VVKCFDSRKDFSRTLENVTLEGVMSDGKGRRRRNAHSEKREGKFDGCACAPHVRPFPEVLEAIARADLILIVPDRCIQVSCRIFLSPAWPKAIESSSATRVYIANLMTQPGETEGFSLSDHVRTIKEHTRPSYSTGSVASNQIVSPEVRAPL